MEKLPVLVILCATAAAGVHSPDWNYQIGSAAWDRAYGVVTDSSGNAFITGYTEGALVGGQPSGGVFLVKCSSTGQELWRFQTASPKVHHIIGGAEPGYYSVATDTGGNAYITGLSEEAGVTFVIKLSPTGQQLWRFETGTNQISDRANGVAVDDSGNVFVTGITREVLFTFLIKVNPTGQELWRYQTSDYEYVMGARVAVHTNGNAFIAGYAIMDYMDWEQVALLIVVGSTGQELWRYQMSAIPGAQSRAHDVAVDRSGDAFVSGVIMIYGTTTGRDALLAKINSTGQELWRIRVGTPGDDTDAYGVALDPGGNAVFMAGTTSGALVEGQPNAGRDDVFLIKYDSQTGQELWRLQTGTSTLEQAYSVAVAASGSVFVAGATSGSLVDGQLNAGQYDAFLLRVAGVQVNVTAATVAFGYSSQRATTTELTVVAQINATGPQRTPLQFSLTFLPSLMPHIVGIEKQVSTHVVTNASQQVIIVNATHNLRNLLPNTLFNVTETITLDAEVLTASSTFQTLRNNVQLSGVPSHTSTLKLAGTPLTVNVPVAIEGPVASSFTACTSFGFLPTCFTPYVPSFSPPDVGSPVAGTLNFLNMALDRDPTRTFTLGSRTIDLSVSTEDTASTDFVPALPWNFSLPITVEGTLLMAVPSVVVGGKQPALLNLEMYPAPPTGVFVTLSPLGNTPSWSSLFTSPPATTEFVLGASNVTHALVLKTGPAGAVASTVEFQVVLSGADSALVTTAPTQTSFEIHNGIRCGATNNASVVHLYAGQSTSAVPTIMIECAPSLHLLESQTVGVEPAADASLAFSPTKLNLQQSAPAQAVDVTAGSALGAFAVSWSVSLSGTTSLTPAFFPVNPDGATLTVEVHAAGASAVTVPSSVAVTGTAWGASLEVSLSQAPFYALDVTPSHAGFDFDPPVLAFAAGETSKTFRVRGKAGTSPGAHAVSFSLGGSDASGYAGITQQLSVALTGAVRIAPPPTALYARNPATSLSLQVTGPPPSGSSLTVSLDGGADLSVTPPSFTFTPDGPTSQAISDLRFSGAQLRNGTATLTASLAGPAAALFEATSWEITLHVDVSDLFVPAATDAVLASFVPSTSQATPLHVPVALSTGFVDKAVRYSRDQLTWTECASATAVQRTPAELFEGIPVYNVTCMVAAGVGTDYHIGLFVVTSETQLDISNGTFSYPAPLLTPGSLRIGDAQASGQTAVFASTVGATDTVYMNGANLGLDASQVSVTFGPQDDSVQFACSSVVVTDTQLQCTMEAGSGINLVFRVAVGGQTVTGTDTYSYPNRPLITRIEGCGADGCPTLGGRVNLTIHGSLFSPSAGAMQVVVGGAACPVLSSIPVRVVCALPAGTGANAAVQVSRVFGDVVLASDAATVAFASPEIQALASASCPTQTSPLLLEGCPRDAAFPLTIDGRHFGPTVSSVLVGVLNCHSLTLETTSAALDAQRVTCTVPAGGKDVNQPVLVITPNALSTTDSSAQAAALSFFQCPAGTFENPTSGACVRCSRFEFQQSAGKFTCDACPSNQYKLSDDPTKADCAICPSTAADCNSRLPVASKAGTWLRTLPDGTVEALTCPAQNCLDASACFGDDAAMAATGAPAVSCCAPGRLPAEQNPLCGRCAPGYAEWGGECVECDAETNSGLLAALALVMWLLVLVFHVLSAQSSTGALRTTVYFWQIALVLLGSRRWSSWAAVFNMNAFQAGGSSLCLVRLSARDKIFFDLLVPFASFPLLLVTALLHKLVELLLCARGEGASTSGAREAPLPHEDHDDEYKKAVLPLKVFSVPAYLRTGVALYMFTYNVVAQTVLDALNCVDVGGELRLFAYPAVSCENSEYAPRRALALFIGIVYLLLAPAALTWWLHRAATQGLLTRVKFRSVWGAVYESYHESSALWGVLALVRRMLIVVLAVFLYRNRSVMFGMTTLACVLFLVGHVHVRPFGNPSDNRWEALCLAALALVSVLLGMWDAETPASAAEEGIVAAVCLVVGMLLIARMLYEQFAPGRAEEGPARSGVLAKAADTSSMHGLQGIELEPTGGEGLSKTKRRSRKKKSKETEPTQLSPKGVDDSEAL